jgi:hypothetical protein
MRRAALAWPSAARLVTPPSRLACGPRRFLKRFRNLDHRDGGTAGGVEFGGRNVQIARAPSSRR